MNWTLLLTKPAQKDFKNAPNPDPERLRTALASMERDPYQGDVTHLHNMSPAFRRRVGNWRIIFDIDSTRRHITVHAIRRRTTTTYKKRK